MPLVIVAGVFLFLLALAVAMPLSLVQRYRVGTARRRARAWVATINLAGLAFTTPIFLLAAAITNAWVPGALRASVLGFAAGLVLGFAGLALTRWEHAPGGLHYTANRWLVLALTLLVTARILYGFVRAWHAWRITGDETSWVAAAGVAGTLAVGALVLGYYVTYWAGVRWRAARARQRR